MTPQPVVRHNDWRALPVPALGEWRPTMSVTVLVPAWNPVFLPHVLAGLAAQTYPEDLLEVVVVDDGNVPPVELPAVRPQHTRVVRVADGWGCANALQTGLEQSTGDIVMWLDADMLAFAEHVEAHARWHHLLDHVVVQGTKRFVPDEVPLTPAEVRDRVADRRIADLHDWDSAVPHAWLEKAWAASTDLATAGFDAFRSFAGATVSMTRAMHRSAGEFDRSLRLGEDTLFAHQLAEAGAIFVPDHDARAWHLGMPHVVERAAASTRFNRPSFAEDMPLARGLRNRRGRAYRVPFLEVVLTVDAAADADRVQHCLDSYLDSDLQDLRVVLVGPWDQLTAERVPPLTDPLRDLGILHRAYRHEPRVDLVGPDDPVVTGRCRSPFRLTVTATDLAPQPAGVRLVVSDLERTSAGRRTFTRSDGREVASLTRTAAYSRADWFGITDSDERDAFVTDTFGGGERPAAEAGWVPATERVVKKWSRVAARTSDEESWALVRAAVAKGQSPPNRSRV